MQQGFQEGKRVEELTGPMPVLQLERLDTRRIDSDKIWEKAAEAREREGGEREGGLGYGVGRRKTSKICENF